MRRVAAAGLAALCWAGLALADPPVPEAANALGAAAGGVPLAVGRVRPPPAPDPFPLRRVVAPADRLPALLKALPPGPVVTLGREDFESRARAAAEAKPPPAPRLVQARYTATHSADGLRGTLAWTFPAGAGPTEFALDSLGVAVTVPPTEASVRLIARPPAGAVLLWPGGGEVGLGWSARGSVEGDAERFNLVLPAAPLASLDLDLPADREPTLTPGPPSRHLSGPLPGAKAGRQRRRILFPGVGGVEFVLRPRGGPAERDPPVRVSRTARYEFTPGVVHFAVECALDPVRGDPGAVAFLVDPRCRVTAVTAPGRVSWSLDEATPDAPTLRVSCPDGLPAKVTVAGFAPLPAAAEAGWPVPDLRLVGGLPGSDALELSCRGDVQWLGCDPGDYRSQPIADPAAQPDGGVRFGFRAALQDGPAAPGAARRMPAVRVRPLGATFSTADELTWHAGTPVQEPQLVARFRVAVERGPLESLTLQLSPGYRVASAEQASENGPLTVSGRRVELARPARSGESVEVVVRLVGPRPGPREAVALPRASCQDASGREGTYTVVVPPGYDAAATAPPAVAMANPTRLRYPLRGRGPNAAVTLTPHAGRLAGTSDTAAALDDGKPCRVTTFRLSAAGGPLGDVRVRVPESLGACVLPGGLVARVAPASPVEAWAPVLAARSPFAALGWAAAARVGDPAGQVRVVTFPQGDATEAVVRVVLFADAAGKFPAAPPVVLAAHVVPAAVAATAEGDDGAAGWRFGGLRRTVSIDSAGRVAVTVGGVLVAGGSSGWRVALPADATVLGVTLGGKSVDAVRLDGGGVLMPAAAAELPFEVRFQTPGCVAPWGAALEAPAVGLPGNPPLPTAWVLPPEYRRWPRLDALPDPTPLEGDVTVVPAALPIAVGWVLAALLLGAAFVAGGRGRLHGGVLVALAAGGLLAAGCLPEGWALALRPVALALFLLAAIALGVSRRPRGVGLALALGLAGAAGAARPADPQTVLLVAGPGEQWTVYAARSTLDAFAALSRPPAAKLGLTGVEYDGRVAAGAAHFRATVGLLAAGDGEEVYELPLGGVRLDSLELDGQPARPEATRADGYAVRVKGRGPHTLMAEFRVTPLAVAGGRAVRFTGPDFPATRVTVRGPATDADVTSRRGAQAVESRGGEAVVTADHGGGKSVVVTIPDASPPAVPVAGVREGHLWDVTGADATLRSAFQWTVSSGALGGVVVEVPAGLEPGVPILRADGPRLGPAPEVRSAVLVPAGAARNLVVTFAAPVTGKFTLLVRSTSRTALAARPVLALPRALTPAAADALVGLRVRGVALDAVEKRGLIDFPADELARRFGALPDWQLDRAAADRVFQRLPGPAAELRPTLRAKPDAGVVACETRWTLGPAVEVDARVAVARFAPADAVEFDWPDGATLHEVRSPDLHGWSKAGSRVQVWFRKPTRQAVITLAGASPAAPPAAGATLDLGAVRAAGVGVLRVRPAAGLEARWVPAAGVALRADSTAAETLLTLDAGVPGGRVQVVPLPAAVEPTRPKPPPPAPVPPPAAVPDPPEQPADDAPADDWGTARGLLVAVAWPLALLAVAVARWRGLPSPECLAACGLLGWGVAGTATFVGLLFLAAGGAGVLWRLAGLAARGARLVLR